jgi:hypothetical protein
MTLKQKIHQHFIHISNEKITQLQHILIDLKESASNETKSTAGDKHETALAMLQIEQANSREQLVYAISQKKLMDNIDPTIKTTIIVLGSFIKTNQGNFYLSSALGKAVVNGVSIISLSAQSPLGNKLLGLKVGDNARINNTTFKIEEID